MCARERESESARERESERARDSKVCLREIVAREEAVGVFEGLLRFCVRCVGVQAQLQHLPAYVSIRQQLQHLPAYVSIRQQ